AVAVAGVAALVAFHYLSSPLPPVPHRPLRIGFEDNPPVQVRTGNGYSGLSVETVREAAKRAGIPLQWVETGTGNEESIRKGLVDLWPLMVDLPDRRAYVHFPRPWMHSSYVLLLRGDAPAPDPGFAGRMTVVNLPLHMRLLRQQFPK